MRRVRGLSRISLSYNTLPPFSADASIYVSFSPLYKVTLKTWSTVGESYDASNAGYYEAGFETKVTSGQTDTFTVTLSPNE